MATGDYNWFFRGSSAFVRWTLGRYLSVQCHGRDSLPAGPFILAGNHVSLLDPLLVCSYVMPQLRAVPAPAATQGLFFWPLRVLLNQMGAFVVDRRNNRNLSTVRGIIRTLRSRPILIFPEGGVTVAGEERSGKLGVGFIARKSNAPIVPFAIVGTEKALPKGGRWVRMNEVTIRFGPAITPDWRERTDQQVTEAVMAAISMLKQTQNKIQKTAS